MPLNFIKQFHLNLEKDQNRKNAVQISRGKSYRDTTRFKIPVNYTVEALPKSQFLKTEFGELEFNIDQKEEKGSAYIVVDQYLKIEEGEWAPEKFEEFRTFYKKYIT